MSHHKLEIDKITWKSLIEQLKIKGKGERETGAFLLGPLDKPYVKEFVCYDVFDPSAYDTGIITFKSEAYIPLWNYCKEHKLRVWADVHTHPGGWTGQSGSDMDHPMTSQMGHIAFIVPNYAEKKRQMFGGVGMYEYLGNHKWKTLSIRTRLKKNK